MIHLSFDIEEFDTPGEYGAPLSNSEQMQISANGTNRILDLLDRTNIKATFFVTANFAQHNTRLIKRIIKSGHELASHSFYHSHLEIADLKSSKEVLEKISGIKVIGFRMPRMKKISSEDIFNAGYKYDSSLNPCYLPGRYNNFSKPYMPHKEGDLIIFPSSVTPRLRIPLFWLTFHNLPIFIFSWLSKRSLRKTGFLNIYFHPWEFADISAKRMNLPFYITNNSGQKMIERLELFIKKMRKRGEPFSPINESEYIKGNI